MKNKRIFLLITILLIILIIGIFIYSSNNKNEINRNSKIDDIVFEENKVNIYLFYGNGCPHCEKELEFLESINEEYKKYCNIYTFEIWHNQDNADFMIKLSDELGEEVTGVPYTIIGNKTFNGFGNSMKKDLKSTIMDQYNNDFDVCKELK
ncbi:MAG: thioredoxin family protein [Bacilli bacterium]|nr:thioredoxin family protein [Bacilli bacterium]